ncbi:MAG: cytochrome c [Gammaproteobacteria bacterium]|nr:cytochrome c [Gammaproteobacteria bacterium]
MKRYTMIGCALVTAALVLTQVPAVLADAAAGKVVYDGVGACASCHGATGKGDGAAAAALNPKPRDFSAGDFALDTDGDGQPGSDTDLFNVIKNGAAKYGGAATMPGRADISDADIKAMVAYIRSLKN